MKKLFALLLALVMIFALSVTAYADDTAGMDELIAAAQEEGSLVVWIL